MTNDENDALLEGAQEEEKKKSKRGKTDQGAPPARGEAVVGQGFFDYMAKIGASKEVVSEILRTWRHLKGEGLLRRVANFMRKLVKSSHIKVDIDRAKDYGVVHNFIQSARETEVNRSDLKQDAKASSLPPAPK